MRTIRLVGALITALAVVLLALALRIASGPISLGPIAPWVEEAIADLDPDSRISLTDASIAWNREEQALDLQLVGVRMATLAGRTIAEIPDARLGVDIPSLLDGEVRPTRLDVVGLALRLTRHRDGSIGLGLDAQGPTGEEAGTAPDLLRELTSDSPSSAFARLRRVRFSEVALSIEDRVLDRIFTAPKAELSLRRDERGIEVELATNLAVERAAISMRAVALWNPASRDAVVRATFADIQLRDLAPLAPVLAPLAGVNLGLTVQTQFRVNLDDLASPVDFVIEAHQGEIALPEIGLDATPVKRLAAHGSIAKDLNAVTLAALSLEVEGLNLRLSGSARLRDGAIGDLDLALAADPFTVPTLKRLWPRSVGPDARSWIVENILAGNILDTRAKVRATGAQISGAEALPADAVNLEWRYEGLEVRYFRPLPTVTAVGGTAKMSAHRLDLAIAEGRVGELAASRGVIGITGLAEKDQFADIAVVIDGPLSRALELLDREPLGFVKRFGFEAKAAQGSARTQTRFKFELKKNLSVDDLEVNAVSDIKGFTYPKVVDRFRASDGAITLKVDRQQLSARGTLALNDVPIQLNWVEKFSGPLASRYDLTGVLDEPARKALNLDTSPYIYGTIGADVIIEVNRAGDVMADGSIDLTDATVSFSPIRWRKQPAAKGMAKFQVLAPKAGLMRVEGVEVTADQFLMRGRATIGPGSERRFRIETLKQEANDLSADVTVSDQSTEVDVKGAGADLRPFLQEIDKAARGVKAPPVKEPPTRVRFALDRVMLSDDVALLGVRGNAEQRDDRLAVLDATGRLGSDGRIEAKITPAGRTRKLAITSADAGAVIKGLGITQDIVGGTLTVDADLADDEAETPTKGRVRIDEFKLLRAPLIARILSIAAVTGIGETLSGEGVNFVRADIPFTMAGGKIKLTEARAWGPSMGFTTDGTIDRTNDTMVLTGTLVPAYAINAVLGNIPILGQILVGRKGEGIFGITYRMSGPTGDPNIEINPLSALTPGFLRRIFEFGDTPAPREAPPPPANQEGK